MKNPKNRSSTAVGLAVAGILSGAALFAGCSRNDTPEPVGAEKNGCSGPNGCAAKTNGCEAPKEG